MNKSTVRVRRTFELVMKSGTVIRYEVCYVSFGNDCTKKYSVQTHSCKVAGEWVDRLSDLVKYWNEKHREDAEDETKILTEYRDGQGPITAPPPLHPRRNLDDGDSVKRLSAFWDFRILEGHMPVVRSGRLFARKKLRGQFR